MDFHQRKIQDRGQRNFDARPFPCLQACPAFLDASLRPRQGLLARYIYRKLTLAFHLHSLEEFLGNSSNNFSRVMPPKFSPEARSFASGPCDAATGGRDAGGFPSASFCQCPKAVSSGDNSFWSRLFSFCHADSTFSLMV